MVSKNEVRLPWWRGPSLTVFFLGFINGFLPHLAVNLRLKEFIGPPNALNTAWRMKCGKHNTISSFLKTTLKWAVLARKLKQYRDWNNQQSYFSLILASAEALCDLDYKALSVYFLMAADSYCLFPETQINGFVKSTFSTAHISHPLGICLKVQASYVCSKRSVPKQTARKSVTWIFKVNWGAACKDMGGQKKEVQNKERLHWPVPSITIMSVTPWWRGGAGGGTLRRPWFPAGFFSVSQLTCPLSSTRFHGGPWNVVRKAGV